MADKEVHAVTGAYGFSGKYIASRLLAKGISVRTLTNSLERRNPFGDRVKAHPLDFEHPENLAEALEGVSVLYNTYWVRFNYRTFTYAEAVRNTRTLFAAAQKAGVSRIVHVSIVNATAAPDLEYFSGKAELEQALAESGRSYAVLRPAVLFGKEGILINNIAWVLRRMPFFILFGHGDYRLQPIHVDEFARIAVDEGGRRENRVINTIGPETFTYRGLVQELGAIIGKPRLILSVPPALGFWLGRLIGKMVGDVVVTRDEIDGLMRDLLYVDAPPAGRIRLTEWARENAALLGRHYASELARRFDRTSTYEEIDAAG